MKQQLRARAGRVLAKVTPAAAETEAWRRGVDKDLAVARRQIGRLRTRITALEQEAQECRRLNRRIAELTDVVQELLIPISQRDEDGVRERLERYSASL
ncbi:MAG: hypothetical protein AVDCRST_MAG72-1722 [uncultured Nocardioidaceae bacterium]|uniref:DUF6752 domain-containing protein n=1 Tax=uncultured Nocardioidaceae bacterium TaxID=253824 RepID=A0A6J4MDU6_9ACTN|nr:MAG: hypothetical protein AVDCRST_MAG72-1722 [uncultured Nocardioidaceae bacterium]